MARGGAGDISMAQGLQKILSELATLQVAQDADPQFLQQLQQVIVGKIRQGMSQPPTGGPGQQAPGMGAGGPPPGGIPGVMGAGPGPSALIPGQSPNVTDMDEIRRMLSQGNAGGQGGGVLPGSAA